MLKMLEDFVSMETPSTDKELLDTFASHLGEIITLKLGTECSFIHSEEAGNDVRCVFNPEASDQILLLAHYDTVFQRGTIEKHPFTVKDGRAYGPGVFDMKGGLVQAIFALEYAISEGLLKNRVVLLVTSDEETGSDFSKEIIQEEAKRSRFTLVMEPSLNGDLKTERKGVGTIYLSTHGKAAHAGLDPSKGINAIYSMCSVVERIKSFSKNLDDKTLITVGTISGGTRTNVIPDECRIGIDVRYMDERSIDNFISFLRSVKLEQEGAYITIDFRKREPMIKTSSTTMLFERVKKLAASIGLDIGEVSSSGGSDGNFCARYCPVLDGLGAVGNGAHSYDEYLIVDTLPQRSALLGLILTSGITVP